MYTYWVDLTLGRLTNYSSRVDRVSIGMSIEYCLRCWSRKLIEGINRHCTADVFDNMHPAYFTSILDFKNPIFNWSTTGRERRGIWKHVTARIKVRKMCSTLFSYHRHLLVPWCLSGRVSAVQGQSKSPFICAHRYNVIRFSRRPEKPSRDRLS